jgi:peptide/nickel transport system permease protein
MTVQHEAALTSADSAAPARLLAGRKRAPGQPLSWKIKLGLILLGAFVIMAIIGPMVAPYDPSAISADILAPPSGAHLLGTTQVGQDVLSQLLVGARSTLLEGFIAGVIATALSIIVGVSSGYFGGSGGESLSLLSNVFLVIPALPLLVALTSYLPNANVLVIAAIISVTAWAWGARVLRAQTLALGKRDFVLAAKASGERNLRIILFEILPNELAVVATSFLFTVLFAILFYVALVFLGLGNINEWSWGTILYFAQNNEALTAGAWWWFIPPGVCIALVGTALSLLNFGLDELINPRLRAAGLTRKTMRDFGGDQGVTPVERVHPRAGANGGRSVR